MTARFAPHGTDTRYSHGSGPDAHGDGAGPPCREDCCRLAHNAAERARRRRAAYGRSGLVDAAPAREHVESLRAGGMSVRRIAECAGLSRSRLSYLVWGRPSLGQYQRTIRAGLAARILAVAPDPAGAPVDDRGEALVSSIGTVRRLQALALNGWTGAELAPRLGMAQKNLLRLRSRGHDQVTVRIARAVAALYDELWDERPPQGTPLQRAFVARTITAARAAGWAPVGAWDDDNIDDPHASPVVDLPVDRAGDPHVVDAFLAERVTWATLNSADRLLLARWCCWQGWSRAAIADRARTDPHSLDYYLAEARSAA